MAKKTVASLQTETNKYSKVIKMTKNKKGNYSFIEKIVKKEDVEKHLEK